LKILVTGGTGFLGCHFMDELCRRIDGSQIRVLSLFDTPALQAHGVEVLVGTVTSPSDVARAMEGITHVYHLAGFVSRRPEDAHLMFDVHVNGTRVVCQAAAAAGVKRIVMSSTSGTIAISEREDEWPDESSPPPLPFITRWPYYASKYYQEAAARRFCGDQVELVMVNPSLLLGPGARRIEYHALRFLQVFGHQRTAREVALFGMDRLQRAASLAPCPVQRGNRCPARIGGIDGRMLRQSQGKSAKATEQVGDVL